MDGLEELRRLVIGFRGSFDRLGMGLGREEFSLIGFLRVCAQWGVVTWGDGQWKNLRMFWLVGLRRGYVRTRSPRGAAYLIVGYGGRSV